MREMGKHSMENMSIINRANSNNELQRFSILKAANFIVDQNNWVHEQINFALPKDLY